MKFKVFVLVLITMVFIENPPLLTNARMNPPVVPETIELPLLDSLKGIANELERVKQENLKHLQLLRQQQQFLKQLN